MNDGKPVKKNDVIIVEVINIGSKGDGIARYDNFVIVVPKGENNKKYSVKVTAVYTNVAYCEIIREIG